MLRVGLTGNIAAGKSSVAAVWKRLGGHVIDADRLAREVVEPGTPALAAIEQEWGAEVLDAEGGLDRGVLRELVFRDPEARVRLERIVHPAVRELRDREAQQAEQRGDPLVIADIPLLFEVGMANDFDVIVLVESPESVRRERLVRDRGLDRAEAERIIAAQMPSELKRARADVVIANTGTPAELEARAEAVWRELLSRAAAGAEGGG